MKSIIKNLLKNKQNNETNSPLKKILMPTLISAATFFIIIVVVITIIFAPIMMAQQYVEDLKREVSLFFEKLGNALTLQGWCADSDGSCQRQAEQKYYEQLDDVYQKYEKKGVEIDVQLITATVFYGNTLSDDKFQDEDIDTTEKLEELSEGTDIHLSDVKTLASHMVSGNKVDYSKYKRYLIDTYIPKRFKNMYDEADGQQGIERIADEIMSFASGKVNTTNLAYASVGIKCDTVLLKSADGTTAAHDLEEYVAGVVEAENGGAGDEALKLQAIAARSFAVKNCDRVIVNSIGDKAVDGKIDQAYKEPSERATAAAQATEGLVLTYNNEVMTISFASYPKANYRGGFPGYEQEGYTCGDVTCENGSDGRTWCRTILYKQPNMEKFELNMPDTQISGSKWNGLSLNNQGGHCYGISQVASAYYENELNYTYEEMVEEFLSPGVEIKSMKTFGTGFINGGTYTSNAPIYENSSIFFSNVNYNYYLSTSAMPDPGNYGECPWYAQGRAIEIVANSDMPEDRKEEVIQLLRNSRVNGGDWYGRLLNSTLNSSNDIYAARPGSIITWDTPALPGHVGIIEDVEYDSDGRATRVLVTESWNGTGNPGNTQYSYSWQTIDAIRRYTGHGHYFIGYTYLLD